MDNAFSNLTDALTPRYGAVEARSIARIVLEDAFHTKNYHQFRATEQEQQTLEKITTALLAGQPVQYVLGTAYFFGHSFKVSPAVLIPRQETEELVDMALKWVKKTGLTAPTILDIGTGSGCIAISIQHKLPQATVFGLEKSPDALDIARYNGSHLLKNQQVQWIAGDILTDTFEHLRDIDLMVSNPPYIPHSESSLMPEHVLAHEPALALFVEGDNPLLFYQAITAFAQRKLRVGGCLCFECNEFNAPLVRDLVAAAGFQTTTLYKDLSGADRMVVGEGWQATVTKL